MSLEDCPPPLPALHPGKRGGIKGLLLLGYNNEEVEQGMAVDLYPQGSPHQFPFPPKPHFRSHIFFSNKKVFGQKESALFKVAALVSHEGLLATLADLGT